MHSSSRVRAADRVRALGATVPESTARSFLAAHPQLAMCFGERTPQLLARDLRHHLSFLSLSIANANPDSFRQYVRWLGHTWQRHGVPRSLTAELLVQLRDELETRIGGSPTFGDVEASIRAGVDGLLNVSASDAPGETIVMARDAYLQALLGGERPAAVKIAIQALTEAAPVDVYVNVLQSSLYEIGRLWEANVISVADEHAATAITESVLAHMYEHLQHEPEQASRGTIVIGGVEDETHGLGAQMIADVLESAGWTVHFIGVDCPVAAILDAVREHEPGWLGLTITMASNVPATRTLIASVRRLFGSSVRVAVGGQAVTGAVDAELGADVHVQGLADAIALFCQDGRPTLTR